MNFDHITGDKDIVKPCGIIQVSVTGSCYLVTKWGRSNFITAGQEDRSYIVERFPTVKDA